MATAAPMIEFEGRAIVMVPQETGRLVQGGDGPIMLSQREVEETVACLERYERDGHPHFKAKYAAKLKAYQELIGGGAPAAGKKG